MFFVEKYTLEQRGAVDPAPDLEVEGTLLIGVECLLSFYAGQCNYGEDRVSIYAAFHNGVKCFIQRSTWCPAHGYSASGTQESIVSFETGAKIFLTYNVFNFERGK